MNKGLVLAKTAAIAQFIDDIGFHDDATIMDNFLEIASKENNTIKFAGLWQDMVSRLGGWARKALFQEYRQMYNAAKETQAKISQKIEELQKHNNTLEKVLKHHKLTDWRDGAAALLPTLSLPVDETLAPYDEQRSQMTARLLKLAPKVKKEEPKTPALSPLLPEEKPEEKVETPEEIFPLTKVKRPAPVPEATSVPAPVSVPPVVPEAAPVGWKKEKFGTSGKHGWEWEWEISPDFNKLRLPKSQLAAASAGKGKILHHQDNKYRPTGGTSSVKLRRLMGSTYWKEENDPSDPNMSILTRTEEVVEPPLSMRQPPTEQAKKLKELGKSSAERMDRLVSIAVGDLGGVDMSDEEKLDAAAAALLGSYEEEDEDEEE